MLRATLFVHTFSLPYVENFVKCLHELLLRHVDTGARLLVADTLDGDAHEPGVVFVIGENLPGFQRRAGCLYVYLNLSVVTLLGNPFSASLSGWRQVFRKRRMLRAKLSDFDIILDYYAPQTAVLQKQLPIPVLGFDVLVPPQDFVPLAARKFDVCFVGGMTPRREATIDALKEQGFTMSPASGAPVENIAARSLCCLNVHTERSNHLEIPRILAALSAGCPIVTETSYGLDAFGLGEFVAERRFSKLATGIGEMLSDRSRLETRAMDARQWYVNDYVPKAELRWARLFERIGEFAVAGDRKETANHLGRSPLARPL